MQKMQNAEKKEAAHNLNEFKTSRHEYIFLIEVCEKYKMLWQYV